MPTAREVGRLDVDAELAEVALDRLPGAPGGDAHRLVVVSLRAARGERVAQPEAVVVRDFVGDVRERRGALVGGHDQVGVVLVVADHALGWHDLALDDVVGYVEHARQEGPIAGDGFLLHGLPPAFGRGFLEHEAPFAPTGTISAFLTIWAFIRPRTSVRKSSRRSDQRMPAAGDLAAAEVDRLDPRRVDEDLELGPRQRQHRDLLGIELERQVRMGLAVVGALEGVGSNDRADHAEEGCAGSGPRRGWGPRRAPLRSRSRSGSRCPGRLGLDRGGR